MTNLKNVKPRHSIESATIPNLENEENLKGTLLLSKVCSEDWIFKLIRIWADFRSEKRQVPLFMAASLNPTNIFTCLKVNLTFIKTIFCHTWLSLYLPPLYSHLMKPTQRLLALTLPSQPEPFRPQPAKTLSLWRWIFSNIERQFEFRFSSRI